ncbi:hypothetical protein [Prescottella sp. R16]|uniref:hypothetical protein n=1 Tax=Prescottella sp. R16 TaxID=3064529 RepID=UPI00272E1763|nr:hypothetical protein [Prescottella sp. R16]
MANLNFGGTDNFREVEETLSQLATRIADAMSEVQHLGLSGVANESAQNIVGQALAAAARFVESIRIVAAFMRTQADSLEATGTLGSAFF